MAADDVGPPGVTTGMGRVEGRLNINGFEIEKCKQTPPPKKINIYLYIHIEGQQAKSWGILKILVFGCKMKPLYV